LKHFNLIDEAWIPVRFQDGSRDELGIQDTLLQAKNIAAIEDASPLVTAALHRLLLAILYRALRGPCSLDEAKALFREGLPQEKIQAYLNTWRERFWLFHGTHPFWQIPDFEPKNLRAWTVLATEHNADNAKVLFDHIDVREPGSISYANAAKWLIAAQTFSVSCGKSELAHTGTSPSATSIALIPIGHNLECTLIFSLVPQCESLLDGDSAIWEREPESVDSLMARPKRLIFGLSDRYTWRSRSIKLHSAAGRVSKVALASGVDCIDSGQLDPMHAYINGKPLFLKERGLWREFDSILPAKDNNLTSNIKHAIEVFSGDDFGYPRSIIAIGQKIPPAKANVEFWRLENYKFPGALQRDPFIRTDINACLDQGESTQSALRSACKAYARGIIQRLEPIDGKKNKSIDNVQDFLNQMPCIPAYWSRLEGAFHTMLQDFTSEANPYLIRRNWLANVRDALQESWGLHSRQARTGDAWAIRALVQAEGRVRAESKRLGEQIQQLDDYLKEEQA
jgi:CRISPR system Cascade subunit CasA